jgi:hypothetical protein
MMVDLKSSAPPDSYARRLFNWSGVWALGRGRSGRDVRELMAGKKWGWTDGATGRWTGTERYIQGAWIDVVLIEIS